MKKKNQQPAKELSPAQQEAAALAAPEHRVKFGSPWRILLAGLLIVAIFFGGLGGWAAVSKISGAVIAQGTVKVASERKTVQHYEGGIVKDIHVEDGDRVQAGDVLVTLESEQVQAKLDQLQGRFVALKAKALRLSAERHRQQEIDWPSGFGSQAPQKAVESRQDEQEIFQSRRQALKDKVALQQTRIEQLKEQIDSLQEQLSSEKEIVASLEDELEAKQELYEQRYLEKPMVLELRRRLAEHRGKIGKLKGSIAEAREKIAGLKLEIENIYNQYTEKATTKLGEIRQKIFEVQENIRPLKDRAERLHVKAPVSGEVVNLQFHSEGGVIKSGEPILDIVPKEAPVIVEAKIRVNDITNVKIGQQADVQLTAFDVRTKPKIKGEVTYISADRLEEKTAQGRQPFYMVHIKVEKEQLRQNDLYLSPGMPATVFLVTEPRTVLNYLLEPITDQIDRALRET